MDAWVAKEMERVRSVLESEGRAMQDFRHAARRSERGGVGNGGWCRSLRVVLLLRRLMLLLLPGLRQVAVLLVWPTLRWENNGRRRCSRPYLL